jgi:hypothetical protein
MQGIEPKSHTNLTERAEYYHCMLKKIPEHSDVQPCDIISKVSELSSLYEEYVNNKKRLEKSIKNYNQYHSDLRKLLTLKIRDARKKIKQK